MYIYIYFIIKYIYMCVHFPRPSNFEASPSSHFERPGNSKARSSSDFERRWLQNKLEQLFQKYLFVVRNITSVKPWWLHTCRI